MPKIIYFVIPCYNEEEVLPITSGRLRKKLLSLQSEGLAGEGSRILFVDDGSGDKTWELIKALSKTDKIFTGIRLSRNRGHQNALFAGLMAARRQADAVISMDADLQDDIDAAGEFLKKFNEGYEIVYGVRSCRDKDTFFKRATAEGFYAFMQRMGVDVVYNHADYRLMSRRALDCLAEYREVNLFLRGIVPLIGFRSAQVTYERGERAAGKSKYPLKKMTAFALDGITSFSVRPIRYVTVAGLLISVFSIAAFLYFLISKLMGLSVQGWTSLGCSIWFIGGIQLLSLGIIGEYIGKIYGEVKARPKYFIEETAGDF